MSMTTYHMDDLELAVPPGYLDNSVHTLEWQTEDGSRVSLVVQRDPSPDRDPVDQLFEQAMSEYGARLPMLHLEDPPEIQLPVPHRVAAMRWKQGQEVIYQVQLFVQLADRNVIATFTARPRYRAYIDEWVGELCRSLMVRHSA
jgi:hypothetical protein